MNQATTILTATTTPIPGTVEFSGRTIGASYQAGDLTVRANYINYKVAGSFDNRGYGAGASYLVTPAANINGGVWYTSDGTIRRTIRFWPRQA